MKKYRDGFGFIVDRTKKPHGVGDSCWGSSWLYFSYLVAAKMASGWDHATWDWIREHEPDPTLCVQTFLESFSNHCLLPDKILTHPSGRANPFSRDQLSPLLLLLAAAKRFDPLLQLTKPAKKIIQHVVDLDHAGKPMSPTAPNANTLVGRGELNHSIRYAIGLVAQMYGIEYRKMKCSTYFSNALSLYELAWEHQGALGKPVEFIDSIVSKWKQLTGEKHKPLTVPHVLPRPYTIWNNIGLLTIDRIARGPNEENTKWGKSFSWFASDAWGPAYDIVCGDEYSPESIEFYKTHTTGHINIVQQRGRIHITHPEPGDFLCLDFPITRALEFIWR